MTTDIDAVIRGDAVLVSTLLQALRRHKIAPRIADAEAFAATNLVLLTRHNPTEVDLDLSLGWTSFEHEALEASAVTRYGKVSVPMARVDDLIVFKAIAARPRDICVRIQPRTLLMSRVRVPTSTSRAPQIDFSSRDG